MGRYVIDGKKLDENIETIKKKAGTEIIGVVKGNGYGFGMSELALILARHENKMLCCYRDKRHFRTETGFARAGHFGYEKHLC